MLATRGARHEHGRESAAGRQEPVRRHRVAGEPGRRRRPLVLRAHQLRPRGHQRRHLRGGSGRRAARRGGHGLARLRQSDRAGRVERRRNGARPGVWRRHRRAARGPSRRPRRPRLRPGHDRRDAGSRPREPAACGPCQRHLPEGGDREGPAAGRGGRRRHLQLRDQPRPRQGSGARRGLPRAAPGRALRGLGHRAAAGGSARVAAEHGAVDRLPGRFPARHRLPREAPPCRLRACRDNADAHL